MRWGVKFDTGKDTGNVRLLLPSELKLMQGVAMAQLYKAAILHVGLVSLTQVSDFPKPGVFQAGNPVFYQALAQDGSTTGSLPDCQFDRKYLIGTFIRRCPFNTEKIVIQRVSDTGATFTGDTTVNDLPQDTVPKSMVYHRRVPGSPSSEQSTVLKRGDLCVHQGDDANGVRSFTTNVKVLIPGYTTSVVEGRSLSTGDTIVFSVSNDVLTPLKQTLALPKPTPFEFPDQPALPGMGPWPALSPMAWGN